MTAGLRRHERAELFARVVVWSCDRACAYMRTQIELDTPVVRFPFWLYFVTFVLGSLQPDFKELIAERIAEGDPFRYLDELHAPPKAAKQR